MSGSRGINGTTYPIPYIDFRGLRAGNVTRVQAQCTFSALANSHAKINFNLCTKVPGTIPPHQSTHGIDHGTWSVLYKMYTKADIPVFQLSVNAAAERADALQGRNWPRYVKRAS